MTAVGDETVAGAAARLDLAARTAVRAVCSDAARPARMRVRGVDATVMYVPDDAEYRRRRSAGLGAVTRLDLLDVLLGLPVGLAVPWCSLAPNDRRAVRELPAGCADVTPAGVIRRLVRPLRVELAIVHARHWRGGLEQAGRFGSYCTRLVVLPEPPADGDRAGIEADYWGIGLVVAAPEPSLLVPPERFEPRAHTAAGWAFAEQVHSAVADEPQRPAAVAGAAGGQRGRAGAAGDVAAGDVSSPAQAHSGAGGTNAGSGDRIRAS